MLFKLRDLFTAISLGTLALTCSSPNSFAADEKQKPTFIVSAIPSRTPETAAKQYKAFVDYLAKKLQVGVKYHPTSSYFQSVRDFSNGTVHLAWFGGITGVQAREMVKGAQAIAQGKIDPSYKSYIIAHKDLGLKKADTFPLQLSGKTFTFGSRTSTSGRLMPTHFISKKTGMTPKKFFGEVRFTAARSHRGVIDDVKNKVVEAGVVSYKLYDVLAKKGTIDPKELVVLWETPGYCDYQFTIRPDINKKFGDGFIEKVQKALIDCKDEAVLDSLLRPQGFIKASNADFEAIRTTMKQIDFDK